MMLVLLIIFLAIVAIVLCLNLNKKQQIKQLMEVQKCWNNGAIKILSNFWRTLECVISWYKGNNIRWIYFLLTQKQLSGLFCGKSVFTGINLQLALFFNKVVGFQPATLLKKWIRHRSLPVNFANFPRASTLKIIFKRLPISIHSAKPNTILA